MKFSARPLEGDRLAPSGSGAVSSGDVAITRSHSGFTLIELLIVIFIIGILISLLAVIVPVAKRKTKMANARTDIQTMVQGLSTYNAETSLYPGYAKKIDESELEEFNAFPELYKKLCYEEGRGGGPSGPYFELKHDSIAVRDYDSDDPEEGYTEAKPSEIKDPEVEKYYFDPWSRPYVYRENGSKRKKRDYMIKESSYDLWSCGPDRKNDAWIGLSDDEEYDDLGNW